MKIARLLVPVALLLVTGSAVRASEPSVPGKAGPKLQSFEFMGCSGDPSETNGSPAAWRVQSARGVTYLLRHSDSCGFSHASAPQASLSNGGLELSYRMETADGMLAACECEYWSKFTFGPEVGNIRSVSLNGTPVRRMGSWPDGR